MKKLMNNNQDRLFLLCLFKNDKNIKDKLKFKYESYETSTTCKFVRYLFNDTYEFIISRPLWLWLLHNNVLESRKNVKKDTK